MFMEMKERQRWTAEEDDILREYVRQYGPRDWHLVPLRVSKPLERDAKSCLERWKNYLKPGIKKGSLTEEEQRLVIELQAKHGNKWKKIAAEVPGRTAKRLGKWWEVFKEKQLREQKRGGKTLDPIEERKYDQILEHFAEKLVKGRMGSGTNNNGFLPPWLSAPVPPPSPSVTLTLSPGDVHWLQRDRSSEGAELAECCRELEEGHRALAAHRKEAAWRLRRLELQLESEKSSRRREITDEIESKIQSLLEEQKIRFQRVEDEYREQLVGLRRDAEAKEQKLAEQWSVHHSRLAKFLDQSRCRFRD